MKSADNPPGVVDEVITEVRVIKRSILERHGNESDRLLGALIHQERSRQRVPALRNRRPYLNL